MRPPSYDELRALYVTARTELHAALCEGAFRVGRDPMDLQGVLAALQACAISTGRARECVRRWLAGLPLGELPECVPLQRVTGEDACDVCGHRCDAATGCEAHPWWRGSGGR